MSSLIQGEPQQQAKRGCCLATGNINERFPNSIQKKKSAKKCFGKTSGVGINVHQNSFMKHAEYIIRNLESTMLSKGKIPNKWLIGHFFLKVRGLR